METARIVLIVGNSPPLRELLETALRAERFRVVSAHDGDAGLEYLRLGLHPALVVVDLDGPRMTAEEFIQCARAIPHTDGVPVVVMREVLQKVLGSRPPGAGPMRMDELLAALEGICPLPA